MTQNGGQEGANISPGPSAASSTQLATSAVEKEELVHKPLSRPRAAAALRRPISDAPHFGDAFTVLVGPEGRTTTFSVHESLASAKSEYFARTLCGDWKEQGARVIRLPDCESAHFQQFFTWLYRNAIFSSTTEKLGGGEDPEWQLLAKRWCLGHYLQAMDFKDAVVDAILDKLSAVNLLDCQQSMHQHIYPNSMPESPVRRLVTDIAASCWSEEYARGQAAHPSWMDFFRDLAAASIGRRGFQLEVKHPSKQSACHYHEHVKEGKPCYKSGT